MKNIITEEKSIVSCNDFELEEKRPNKLLYRISYPASEKIQGIVFVTLGFGAEPSYVHNLCTFIAEEFSVLAVDVSYHCFFSRPHNGATLEFDDLDLHILQDFIDKYKMDFSGLAEVTTDSVMKKLNDEVGRLKSLGVFSKEYKLQQSITLIPKHNEYQNFGMMQAVDHINVLHDIEKMSLDFIDDCPVAIIGSSHGGYIAHLIAKLAPNKIDYVIENSCYVKPLLSYVVGKETNILSPEFIYPFEHVQFNCFVQTLWTTNSQSPNFFSPGHYKIRDLSDSEHLQTLAEKSDKKTKYISYHSAYDGLVPINEKISFYEELESLGFEAKLNIIKEKSQVDGKFIKSLSHAMDMSLKELAKRELPSVFSEDRTSKEKKDDEVVYICDKLRYKFKYTKGDLEIDFKKLS